MTQRGILINSHGNELRKSTRGRATFRQKKEERKRTLYKDYGQLQKKKSGQKSRDVKELGSEKKRKPKTTCERLAGLWEGR